MSDPARRVADSLTAKTVSGLRWSTMESGCVAAIQLVYVAVMSRLLDPVVFGLMAMANLTVGFGQNFARMGVSQALIQKPELTRDDVRAGFSAGVVLGAVCFTALWLLTPLASSFFSEPDVVPLLRVMGIQFLLIGMGMTSQGLLRREMRFRELAVMRVTAYLLGYGPVGMGLAVAGAGVWSLVAAVLTVPALEFGLQYTRTRHALRPAWRWGRLRAVLSYGARRSVLGFLEWASKNVDTLMVGRYAATAMLGQYSRAFTLINLPLSNHLSSSLSKVLFPGFSKIQTDVPRLRRAYVSVLSLGGLVLLPLCAGIAVAAVEVVNVALGDQWDVAATLVPWFALSVGLHILSYFAQLVCEARAELNKAVSLQTVYLLLLVGVFVSVSGLNAVWVFAAALAGCEIACHIAYILVMRSLIGLRFSEVTRAYAPPVFAAAVVAGTVFLTRQALLAQHAPVLAIFTAEIVAGAVGLILGVRLSPQGSARRELYTRLAKAGLSGPDRPGMRLLIRLALGSPKLPHEAPRI